MAHTVRKHRREIFYTPRQVARWLGVQPRTVVRWINEGSLEGRKFGRVWRISKTEYQRFISGL